MKPDRVDHERVAFPMPNRVAARRRIELVLVDVSLACEINVPHDSVPFEHDVRLALTDTDLDWTSERHRHRNPDGVAPSHGVKIALALRGDDRRRDRWHQ